MSPKAQFKLGDILHITAVGVAGMAFGAFSMILASVGSCS